MSRYLEFQNGVAINELITSGVPNPPVGRFMSDVTNRPDILVGVTVLNVDNLSGLVDVTQLIFGPPVVTSSPPVISTMEQTVNKIAAKLGVV